MKNLYISDLDGTLLNNAAVLRDDTNDIKMLQKADRAVAVANAIREVREVAHFTKGPTDR